MKCEKCGADMPRVYGPTTSLIGGVVATLCAQCRTEWNRFINAHPAFQRLRELGCVLNSMVYAEELQHAPVDFLANIGLRNTLKEIQECEKTLHGEGLKWIGRED